MHDHPRGGMPYHPIGCRCRSCTPAGPDGRLSPTNFIASAALAGFVAAIAAIEVYAAVTGAPGIGVIFQ